MTTNANLLNFLAYEAKTHIGRVNDWKKCGFALPVEVFDVEPNREGLQMTLIRTSPEEKYPVLTLSFIRSPRDGRDPDIDGCNSGTVDPEDWDHLDHLAVTTATMLGRLVQESLESERIKRLELAREKLDELFKEEARHA